jgi:hypothetical protein
MTKSFRSDWRPAKKEKPPTGPGGENEFGLDHNESRSWHGWHRHVSLVMLAFAMMAAIRHRANRPAPPRGGRAGSLFRVGAPPKGVASAGTHPRPRGRIRRRSSKLRRALTVISHMPARLVHIAYLIAIAIAMVGWGWLIFDGVKWLVS